MVDYKEVLADLRRRKAQVKREFEQEMSEIDAAIGAIEKMVPDAQISLALPAATKVSSSQPYKGLTVRDAAWRCLDAEGAPMKTKDLAEALIAGGLQTTAKNFRTTVYSTLSRDDDFSVDDGSWSLAEWALAGVQCRS